MKSIDEAGVKWHLSHPDADKEETWKAGANYVLEQIEQLTNNQNWCAFPKQSHKELKELITKLKKK